MSPPSRQVTDFESTVYAALREIPHGRVVTYARLAARLGCGSPRAVGQALRRNPFAPEVPCHRVIRSDLRIGGYAGKTAGVRVDRKRRLLEAEGVPFNPAGRLSDKRKLWNWE